MMTRDGKLMRVAAHLPAQPNSVIHRLCSKRGLIGFEYAIQSLSVALHVTCQTIACMVQIVNSVICCYFPLNLLHFWQVHCWPSCQETCARRVCKHQLGNCDDRQDNSRVVRGCNLCHASDCSECGWQCAWHMPHVGTWTIHRSYDRDRSDRQSHASIKAKSSQ